VKNFPSAKEDSLFVARQTAAFISDKQVMKEQCVPGLAPQW
jgi:hypothetical protein